MTSGDQAGRCLLRDFSQTLATQAKSAGLDAALAGLAAAASDPNPEHLLKFLVGP